MSKQRLSKVLAAAGIASRRKCEELIFEGRVSVDGEITLVPQTMVDPAQSEIAVDGESIETEEKVAYLLNKPIGYLCSNKKISSKDRLVADLFKPLPYRLFTVGRLDKETSGLLIVTNDGQLSQKIIHPSSDIEKEYIAATNRPLTAGHLKRLRQGTTVEGTRVVPVKVKQLDTHLVAITVKEGKKREVRLLVEAAGLSVTALQRVRIGKLTLPNIAPGEYIPLTQKHINQIFR